MAESLTVTDIVALAEPSKVVPPEASPLSAIVLAVANFVAVAAFPVIFPGKAPLASLTGTVLATTVAEGLYPPTLAELLTVADIVALAEPSKVVLPEASPLSAIVLAVVSLAA